VILKLGRPSATFPKLNFRKWLLVNLRINLLPDRHIVDRYFFALKNCRYIMTEKVWIILFQRKRKQIPIFYCYRGRKIYCFFHRREAQYELFPEDKVIRICIGPLCLCCCSVGRRIRSGVKGLSKCRTSRCQWLWKVFYQPIGLTYPSGRTW